MFTCERCGSSYSASHIGVENCPRCMLLDRVQTPLTFKVFRSADLPRDRIRSTTEEFRRVRGKAQQVRAAR